MTVREWWDVNDADGGLGRLAILIPADSPIAPGVTFLTDPRDPQQVGLIRYAAGHVVAPHVHREWSRTVTRTTEVLFVRSGRIRVDLYALGRIPMHSFEAGPGDVVVLYWGGHGLTALTDADLIEIKQGPYAGSREQDKREL